MPAPPASAGPPSAAAKSAEIIMAREARRISADAAGRRGSSEDDLLLRLNHAQDLGVGRGLNPAPDERGPATCVSMTKAWARRQPRVKVRWRRVPVTSVNACAPTAFVAGGRHLSASSRSGSVGCRVPSSAISCSGAGSLAEPPLRRNRSTARSCSCAARLVRTRLAWSALASRLARDRVAAMTARSSKSRTVSARAGKGEDVGDRLESFCVGDCVPAAVEDAEAHSFFVCDAREELGAVGARAADLEMRCARAAQRASPEQGAAHVRGAAARARDDSSRWMFERRQAGAEDSRLVENLQRAVVSGDVQLVARSPVEGTSRGRCGSRRRRRTRAGG